MAILTFTQTSSLTPKFLTCYLAPFVLGGGVTVAAEKAWLHENLGNMTLFLANHTEQEQ